MKALLSIGNEELKDKLPLATEAIERIFKTGFENHIEQSTISDALRALTEISEVKNITVTNSIFKGGHVIKLDGDDTEIQDMSKTN